MLLLIDNYDSFTWNLVQRIGELDPAIDLRVIRNDRITPDEAEAMRPERIIISPGPCSPTEAGVSNDILRRFAGRVPTLGVCLGHQCIGHISGMVVGRAPRVMHGKTSLVHHDGLGIYEGLSNPFVATRYHSLIVRRDSVPREGWKVSAWAIEDDPDSPTGTREIVMGLRRDWATTPETERPGGESGGGGARALAPLEGVQFHPESFLTVEGPRLLANFLGVGAPSPGVAAGAAQGAVPGAR